MRYLTEHGLKPVRTAAPGVDLLTLVEVKQHCEVELLVPDHDEKLEGFIATATGMLDGYGGILGRALVNQTWRLNFSCWPGGGFRLPLAPVSAITSIKYYDAANLQQTLLSVNYSLLEDLRSPFVEWTSSAFLPGLYDRTDAIEILFVAGYGAAASDVPAPIKTAAKMLIATWFENRETTIVGTSAQELPFSVRALLAPYMRDQL